MLVFVLMLVLVSVLVLVLELALVLLLVLVLVLLLVLLFAECHFLSQKDLSGKAAYKPAFAAIQTASLFISRGLLSASLAVHWPKMVAKALLKMIFWRQTLEDVSKLFRPKMRF